MELLGSDVEGEREQWRSKNNKQTLSSSGVRIMPTRSINVATANHGRSTTVHTGRPSGARTQGLPSIECAGKLPDVVATRLDPGEVLVLIQSAKKSATCIGRTEYLLAFVTTARVPDGRPHLQARHATRVVYTDLQVLKGREILKYSTRQGGEGGVPVETPFFVSASRQHVASRRSTDIT